MKKTLLGFIVFIAAVLIFTGGVYASQWLSFTGDDTAQQTHNEIDEILALLEAENSGKITAEQLVEQLTARVDELEDMNPAGLAKLNKELRDEIEQLKNNNAQLTTDLNAKQKEIDEKNTAYDQLQQERDGLQTTVDGLNAQINDLAAQISTLQASKDENDKYIQHLESELTRANNVVNSIGEKSSEALQQAIEITGGE